MRVILITLVLLYNIAFSQSIDDFYQCTIKYHSAGPALVFDSTLSKAAQMHADYLAIDSNKFSHIEKIQGRERAINRTCAVGLNLKRVAEICLYFDKREITGPDEVFNGFKASDPHWNTILYYGKDVKVVKVGVGYVKKTFRTHILVVLYTYE